MIDYSELSQTELFSGLKPDELSGLLGCLSARQPHYTKDEFIIEEGEHVTDFGMILSGHGQSFKWDASGKQISCLLRPTAREKILSYFRQLSREKQSRLFDIPLSRNTMAEYLNEESSALSRELSAMKREGLIDYYRNSFRLL